MWMRMLITRKLLTVSIQIAGERMLLLLNSISHFLVDALCAATVFGRLGSVENLSGLILLYNTLAFSTQCIVGLAADRLRRQAWAGSFSMLAVVAGHALPLPTLMRIILIGLGNSGFHVAGGIMTLKQSEGRAGKLGLFVAPGAVGLTLGTLLPALGTFFAVLLTLCAAALPPVSLQTPMRTCENAVSKGMEEGESVLIAMLLAIVVAVRAVGGSAVTFPWRKGAALTLLMTLCVFAGKSAGGFLCDRIGVKRAVLLSVLPAAFLIAFGSTWILPSLAGQFALNLTMPVTLWLMYRAMPDAPGFAFGLAASALWPGTLTGQFIELTGPIRWIFVLLCFLCGLWALLFSEKKLRTADKEIRLTTRRKRT